MKVKVEELKNNVLKGVKKLGYKGEDAEMISAVLLYAELRKNNQGIAKIATGGVPEASDVEEFKIAKQNKCGALISGGHSMSSTAKACDMAVDLAKEHGVGLVCVNHTHTSSGALGYFSKRISEKGFIGFVCTGNGDFRMVAPFGSNEPQFGTNPLSYGFPYDDGEVVFDNATSAMAFFGLIEAKLKGEDVPQGVGYDKNGNATTDPAEILDGGCLTTFAEHKGYGLSLLVQLLGGPFSMAGTPGVNEDDGAGTFVLAIDPALFGSKDEYMDRATKLVNNVKNSKPAPGMKVFLPGERGDAITSEAEESGEIEIADEIWNELVSFLDK